MNVHFYFRSKIESTVEKSVLYEEIATKLYFRLAGGNKSILPHWTTHYTVSQVYTWIVISHLVLTQENGFSQTDFKVYSRHDRRKLKESFKPF